MKKSHSHRNLLQVDALENRMMLSTVSILASGDMGDETMNLLVDGAVVQTWNNIGTETQDYVYESESSLSSQQIRISFTNDLYRPAEGVDRNLNVQSMSIDGETYSTDASNVFASGAWNPDSGAIESGYGRGQTLHANGYFQFPGQSETSVSFAGRTWAVVDGQPSNEQLFVDDLGDLTLSGEFGPLAVSTKIDVVGGETYRLALDAKRLPISGTVGANGPWSTIGINYYNDSGQLLGQETIEINDGIGFRGDRLFDVPESATDAYLWAWIDGHSDTTTIPLKIRDVDWRIEPGNPTNDTTAPTASFNSFTFDRFNEFSINFGVDFSDDQELAAIRAGVIEVTDPSGNLITPGIAFGPSTNTDSFKTLVFTMSAPNGDTWGPAENGDYTVTLVSDQLSDISGNFAEGRVLGTLTVDIAVPQDSTPPVVELTSAPGVITSPPTGGRGSDIEFTVTYTDNVALGDFAQDRILVQGPNGYSGFGRGIAGGGIPNGFFEITYIPLPADGVWNANDNGQYTVTLLSDTVFDELGNSTPGRLLGTFEIQLPEIAVG